MICDRCTAEIENPRYRLPPPWFDHDRRLIAGHPCSWMRWRLLEILWRRRDRYVSRDGLMQLLYSDRFDDPPDDRNISFLLCYLRRLLRPTPYDIECRKLIGWRIIDRYHQIKSLECRS
jgi:DNA-binding response OmpR family regulator